MLDKIIDIFLAILTIAFGIFVVFSVLPNALSGEAQLRKAEWNRQIQVREAQAKMDVSKLLAQAEIERAKGVSEANKIIGESLKGNESYLRCLWVDSLQLTKDKIIYVPTESGLPMLETTRIHK